MEIAMSEERSQESHAMDRKNDSEKSSYISYPVRIRIISQKGTCAFSHKVGDEWIYTYEPGEGKKPVTPNICDAALHMLYLYLKPLWWGATIPAPVPDPDTFFCACPDPINPVVFELKRLKDQPIYLHFPEKLDIYLDRDKVDSELEEKQ